MLSFLLIRNKPAFWSKIFHILPVNVSVDLEKVRLPFNYCSSWKIMPSNGSSTSGH